MRNWITRQNPHLLLALAIALAYHGSLVFYTFKRTYDAYVHIFFADHYARAWFDHWDYRWYTGFTLTSYPPGSQQSIALLSPLVGLQNGFIIVQTLAVLWVTIGIYRFSKLWVSEEAAGYAALLTVFSSSITETIHVFGQLPTTFSLGFLLNALPFVRQWLDTGNLRWLLTAWALNAATTAGHHVTTLFGAIFFVMPVIAGAVVERFRTPLPDEPAARPKHVSRDNIRPLVIRRLRRILPMLVRAGIYGAGLGAALLLVVLPYWLWSKADPITQVSIPHASRDSFIENPNAGLVFWLIPYGLAIPLLPYVFYKGLLTRAWPLTLSFAMCVFLGTGGTTPFPKMLLRGAFDVLTLDRFTFWATILMLPLLGEFVVSVRHGGIAKYTREQFGDLIWYGMQFFLVVAYIGTSVFITSLTQFRKFQPEPIDAQPLVNFLEKDEHWRWRYLTLGFGDQLAWISAQTTATTVDGNYHSARRLPELTTTPVERLEGAKFRGIPGIGSLQQFLAVPEKYNLKFVFSNDQFYDPLLYFSGWHRLQRLENGIMVWERADIPPLPEVLPRREIPIWQRVMWGLVPLSAIALAFFVLAYPLWGPLVKRLAVFLGVPKILRFMWRIMPGRRFVVRAIHFAINLWRWFDGKLREWSAVENGNGNALIPWQTWKNWIERLPRPKPAGDTTKLIRTLAVIVLMVLAFVAGGYRLTRTEDEPQRVLQAYYDDLDFRRFAAAYARLNPQTRPTFDQWRLDLSVKNGLLASYSKLDALTTKTLDKDATHATIRADAKYITALNEYYSQVDHAMVRQNGVWYIEPDAVDITVPPDQFFRQGIVAWGAQGRRVVDAETTAFGDIQDRPDLQLLSARLVRVNDRYSVVGEVMNTDADPADLTVTSYLYDDKGEALSWYDAQTAIAHKLFPKEVTPFRVDFEGVAGSVLTDTVKVLDFKPGDFTPPELEQPVAAFETYAKAVVTSHDLHRQLALENIRVVMGQDGQYRFVGDLVNNGTVEGTIPHLLITYYDENDRVVWVDQAYVDQAVRPQRTQPFQVPITPASEVETILDKGDLFANVQVNAVQRDDAWQERIELPPGLGYKYARLSVNYFTGTVQ